MSSSALRLGDPGTHGGRIVAGASTVLVQGRPAARLGDAHIEPPPWAGHGAQSVASGSGTVFAEGRPMAREGDSAVCGARLLPTQGSVRVG